MLFKLSNLNSNLALTLGYLNPALNNLALVYMQCFPLLFRRILSIRLILKISFRRHWSEFTTICTISKTAFCTFACSGVVTKLHYGAVLGTAIAVRSLHRYLGPNLFP